MSWQKAVPTLICLLGCLVWHEVKGDMNDSDCPVNAKSCGECISANPNCAWCSETVLSDPFKIRCKHLFEMRACSPESIINPKAVNTKLVKDKKLKRKRVIKPQKMDLKLRKGASTTIDFQVFARKRRVILSVRHSKHVAVKLTSNCAGFIWKKRKAVCNGVSRGVVNFSVTLKLKKCLTKRKRIKISVKGEKKATLKINLQSVCQCDCEAPDMVMMFSAVCNFKGSFACGICSCAEGYHGPFCRCRANADDVGRCTKPGSVKACSGRGKCVCGLCECYPLAGQSSARRYSGPYCECNDYACDYSNGQLCGGRQRGECNCGACRCRAGYSGQACELSLKTDKCVASNGQICNGKGNCINNECVCDSDSYYAGPTCEECPTCPGKCSALKQCVQCYGFRSGPFTPEECIKECSQHSIELVHDVMIRDRDDHTPWKQCLFRDDDDCLFTFAYHRDDSGRTNVKVQRVKMCTEP